MRMYICVPFDFSYSFAHRVLMDVHLRAFQIRDRSLFHRLCFSVGEKESVYHCVRVRVLAVSLANAFSNFWLV